MYECRNINYALSLLKNIYNLKYFTIEGCESDKIFDIKLKQNFYHRFSDFVGDNHFDE